MQMLKTVRALDGILYSVIALVIMMLHPSLGRDLLDNLDILCVLPVFALAGFCCCVPAMPPPGLEPSPGPPDRPSLGGGGWEASVLKLRISALVFAGLSPFAIWWLRRPADNYLLINFVLCLLGSVGCFFFLSLLSRALCRFAGHATLEWEAKLTKNLVFWLLLVVVMGGILVILGLTVLFFASSPGENLAYVLGLPGFQHGPETFLPRPVVYAVRLGILAPVVFFASLILRVRFILVARLKEQLEDTA